MLAFLDPFVAVLHTALVHLAAVLPGPRGLQVSLALVLLTVLLRVLLLPLALRGFRGQQARAALAPELALLQKRHANDRARLMKEIQASHERAGISPFTGLGASLAQAPALMASYRLVMSPVVAGQVNLITTVSVLGTPLSAHWLPVLASAGIFSGPALLSGALLLGLVGVCVLQFQRQQEAPIPLRLLPFGSIGFAALAPVAFSIYLLTSTTWTVVERTLLPRLAGA